MLYDQLYRQDISNCYFLLSLNHKAHFNINQRESGNGLLSIFKLLRVVIHTHSLPLLSGETAELLTSNLLVLLLEVLQLFVIEVRQLKERLIVIPHALHKVLREVDQSCHSLCRDAFLDVSHRKLHLDLVGNH